MLYKVRAYPSRSVGESGRKQPLDECQTGNYTTAEHEAKAFSAHYGAAVIINTETGARTWF